MAASRIVCVSANPAMDRRLRVSALAAGEINRAESAEGFAGGKAAHVAMAVRGLGESTTWIGFLGGAIGEECGRQLRDLGIQVISISTGTSTRVNLEIIDASGKITEILEPGYEPTAESQERFVAAIQRACHDAVLILSGSLPAGLPTDFYVSIIETARAAGARTFVDTSGEALRATAAQQASFLKVNRAEVEFLAGRSLKGVEETVNAAREIIRRGPESVAITGGEEGVVWLEGPDGPAWRARPPRLQAISTVGCGDATLAGFAVATVRGMVGEEAIRLAVACGSANCVAAAPGRIEVATVQALLSEIEVEQVPLEGIGELRTPQ
jgi:1-phosphofructokinase family hexose kinase